MFTSPILSSMFSQPLSQEAALSVVSESGFLAPSSSKIEQSFLDLLLVTSILTAHEKLNLVLLTPSMKPKEIDSIFQVLKEDVQVLETQQLESLRREQFAAVKQYIDQLA